MGIKRTREAFDAGGKNMVDASKKPKKGFSVGPVNLPDGTHKRKGSTVTLD